MIIDTDGLDLSGFSHSERQTIIRGLRTLQFPSGAMKDSGAGTFNGSLEGQPTKCWQAMVAMAIAEIEIYSDIQH